MPHRRRRTLLAAFILGAAALVAAPVGPFGAAAPDAGAATPTFSQSWSVGPLSGRQVTMSSPVVVDNGGNPFVAVGDNQGTIQAFSLSNGAPVVGLSGLNTGYSAGGVGIRAPLSSDGTSLYVPVATNGMNAVPQYRKYSANGTLQWSSNPFTNLSTGTFLLSGLSLMPGGQSGVGGSSGQWIHSINGGNGTQSWSFRNADSTMATPAIANLYGTGSPQVITSSDTTAEFPGDRNGGILRVFTSDGRQVCSATQLVNGNTYAASGYNNSSPAVAKIDGRPLIVFGSTGPAQYGVGNNQVLGYDADCTLRWASPELGGRTDTSPSFADVDGDGGLDVIEVVQVGTAPNAFPRVYVLNGSNGSIIFDTGYNLAGYKGSVAYPSSVRITTADVDGDGAQDLFVPANQGQFLVLNGRNLAVMTTINTNLVIQNTPVVTQNGSGVRITMAGYNGLGEVISSYTTSSGGSVGAKSWRSFGNDAQLTGTSGTFDGPFDAILQDSWLFPGQSLRRNGWTATMQTDGNFVVYDPRGAARWYTGTRAPGAALLFSSDGTLSIRSGATVVWSTRVGTQAFSRFQLGADGVLRAVSEPTVPSSRSLTAPRTNWDSVTGLQPVK